MYNVTQTLTEGVVKFKTGATAYINMASQNKLLGRNIFRDDIISLTKDNQI